MKALSLLALPLLFALIFLLSVPVAEAGYLFNTKTVVFFINQSDSQMPNGNWFNSTYDVQLPDPTPQVISAFIEVSGSFGKAGTAASNIKIAQNGGAADTYSFTNSGETEYFTILDNSSGNYDNLYNITNSSSRRLKFGVQCNGDLCNSVSARAIITYTYDPPGTGPEEDNTKVVSENAAPQFPLSQTHTEPKSILNWLFSLLPLLAFIPLGIVLRKKKPTFLAIIFIMLFIPLTSIPAFAATEVRTVDFFVNASGPQTGAGVWWNSTFSAALSDNAAVVKNAWFETWGSNDETGTVDRVLNVSQNSTNLGPAPVSAGNGEASTIRIVRNASNNLTYMLNSTPSTFLYGLKAGAPTGALGTVMKVTYQYTAPAKTKTVEVFINSTNVSVGTSTWWNSTFTVALSGTNIAVKSSYIKLTGVYPGSAATTDNTLDLRLNGTNILSPVIAGTTPSYGFVVLANASSVTGSVQGLYGITDNSTYGFAFGVKCGAGDTCEAMSASVIITYTSDAANYMDTEEYYVNSSTATVSAGSWWNSTFTIKPIDDDFVVKSAFLQVEGLLDVSALTTAITVSMNSTPYDENTSYTNYTFVAGVEIFNYMIRHNATTNTNGVYNLSTDTPKTFSVNIKCQSNVACPLKSVKLVATGAYSDVPKPRFVSNTSSQASGVGINTLTNYTFSTNVSTESVSINNVTFETNLNATLKNFTIPAVAGGNATQKFYFINFTGSTLSAGNYQYRWIANDSANNINTTGIIPFSIANSQLIFVNNASSMPSNFPINATANYGFSTNITTFGTEIINVTFETNLNATLKNFTISAVAGGNTTFATYTINFTSLTGLTNGTYQYRWIVNDSASGVNTTGVIPYSMNPIPGAASIKTIEWFVNSSNMTTITGDAISNFSIYIPERGVSVKSAWIEVYREGSESAGDYFVIFLNGTPLQYASKAVIGDADLFFPNIWRFNASNASANFNGLYSIAQGENNFGIEVDGFAKNSFNGWIKAYVTYEYDTNSETQLKTVTYFVNRTANVSANSNFTNYNFNLYIPEDQVKVRNSFIEVYTEPAVSGTTKGKTDVYINGTGVDYGLNRSLQTTPRAPTFLMFNASNSTLSYANGLYTAGTGNNLYNITVRSYTNRMDNVWIKVTATYSYAANSTTQLNSVKFFGNRSTFAIAANTNWSSLFDIFIPETSVTIRNAYLDFYTHGNGTAGGTMNISINQSNLQYSSNIAVTDTDIIAPIWVSVNASDGFGELYSTTTGSNRHNVSVWVRTQAQKDSWFRAGLVYTYANDSTSQLKTIGYFINQSNTTNAAQNASTQALYIYTPDNPTVRNSWVDTYVHGSTAGAGQVRIWINHSQINQGQTVIPDTDTVLSPFQGLFNASATTGNDFYALGNATTQYNFSIMVITQQMFNIAPVGWFTYTYSPAPPPQFQNNVTSQPSGTVYQLNKNWGFQTNWTDNFGVQIVFFESNFNSSLKNFTVGRTAGDSFNGLYLINFTNISTGSYQYRWIANDTDNYVNTTGVIPYSVGNRTPVFINNATSIPDLDTIHSTGNYGFSTNISTEVAEIVNVTFETNLNSSLKNFTLTKLAGGNLTQAIYTINFTGLTNGTYQYRWIANDTMQQINDTGVIPYIINPLVGNHSIKTIEWFINSSNMTDASGVFTSNFSVYIPERGVSVKSAWIEVYTEGDAGGGANLRVLLNGTPLDYASKVGIMDADQVFPSIYRFNASNTTTPYSGLYGITQGDNKFGLEIKSDAKQFFNTWAKAYITYEYDIISETHLKTITYFVNRTANITANSNFTTMDFNLYIPENQITVRNAFVEVYGETNVGGTAQGKADVYINQTALYYSLNRSVQTSTRAPIHWAFNASNNTQNYVNGFYNAGTGNNYYNVTFRTYTNRLDDAWIKATVTYSYDSSSTTQLKHVRFFGNRTFSIAANTNWSSLFDMYIPESSVAVRSAYLTIYTQGNGTAGGIMNITVNGSNLQYGNNIGVADTDFISPKWIIVNGSDGSGEFYSTTTGDNRHNVTLWARTQAQSNTWFTADLIYTYPNDSSTQLKTIGYFTNFSNTTNAAQNASTQALYIYTPDNPAVRNSWIDIPVKGSTAGVGQIRPWINHSQVQQGQIVVQDSDLLSPEQHLFNASNLSGNSAPAGSGIDFYGLANATTQYNFSIMVITQQMFDIAPTAWFTYTYTAVAPNNNPNYTNNFTSVPSATVYAPGKNYGFQANWSDDGGIDTVLFEANLNSSLTNYTVARSTGDQINGLYVINFSDLAGGSYQYRWIGTDTTSKVNTTRVIPYSVAVNTSNFVDLTLDNGTVSFNSNKAMFYGANIIATASKNFSTAGTANLFRDGVSKSSTETIKLGAGTYSYKVNMSSNANYSANDTGASYTLTVNTLTPTITLTISPSSPITYPTTSQSNCSSSNTDAGVTVKLYRNISSLSFDVTTPENSTTFRLNVSTWQYICNSTATTNFTVGSSSLNYLVNKGATNLTVLLNGTDGNRDYNDTDTLNITVLLNSTTQALNFSVQTVKIDSNFTGWINATSGAPPLINLTGPFSTAGNYNVTGYFTGDENYSAGARTVYANVSGAACSISLGLSTNLSAPIGYDVINPGTTINATGNNGTGVTTFSVQLTNAGCSADIWLRANDHLTNKTGGTSIIGISNMTFLNSSTDNTLETISPFQTMSLTDQLVKSQIAAGTTTVYFKFRLAIPTGQTPGLYNNSIIFTANKSS
ncbi:MAG: hypothetical protein HY362_02855 [Candidatus Aenigmarchaeota archaeon]|nr:hypothetical protein [Candidatus Aenigmarchaeota archaeon]